MNPNNFQLNRPQPIPIRLFSASRPFRIRRFPLYRRRRIKRTIPSASGSFHNILSQFPTETTASVSSFGLLAASFSGLTLYLSRKFSDPKRRPSVIGEWILFTSPTPFNRFVFLRCPTVSFEGGGNSASLSDRLIQENRHFVRLDTGRIVVAGGGEEEVEETEVEYQRVCVSTADGGFVSLDWPANLDLEEEHGLDTTLLLVPGTPQGSMDADVRSFVSDALGRGVFPVVMNPRGCAGSPLTTARLFTAADSDDISTAIKYISKARPWTTIMGVGWGYGANMLTKYLAEAGERTPLTAVTCINNPFDLEEATRCSPYNVAFDRKLMGGLVDILQSNKELFQGSSKGFNVEKALSARTVRDFEKAISMVSCGFEEIEDFYSNSSTRAMIGDVKIPVLFIQSDEGTVPPFSIPRSLIAENPYTSLLLCSYAPDSVAGDGRTAVSWCQKFAVEWLAAVELGLLKGRHPLLKDIDVKINPSKGLALMNNRASDNPAKFTKLLDVRLADAYKNSFDSPKELSKNDEKGTDVRLPSHSPQDFHKSLELKEGSHSEEKLVLQQTRSVDSHLVTEEQSNAVDTERGRALQTVQVVMKMLNATAPGILDNKEKEKVLRAVSRGETLMTALQDAVPEDVREKLTNSVSAILQARQTNLKLDKLLGMDKFGVSAGLESKIQENVGVLGMDNMQNDAHSSDQMKKTDNLSDGFESGPVGNNKTVDGQELGSQPITDQQHFDDTSPSQEMNSRSRGPSDPNTRDSVNSQKNDEATKDTEQFNSDGKILGTGIGEAVLDGESSSSETNRDYVAPIKEEHSQDSPAEQDMRVTANTTDKAMPEAGYIPTSQPNENEGSHDQKSENKPADPVVAQNSPVTADSRAPTFDVAQALDAFTGMDDSTQVAVNSVFGVIEDIISHMEQEDCKDSKDGKEDASIGLKSNNLRPTSDHQTTKEGSGERDSDCSSDSIQGLDIHKSEENNVNGRSATSSGLLEQEFAEDPMLMYANGAAFSKHGVTGSEEIYKNKMQDQPVSRKSLDSYTSKQEQITTLQLSSDCREGYLQNEHLGIYPVSKIPCNKSLDLDATTSLLLDYLPEEGQWKLLEEIGNSNGSIDDDFIDSKVQVHSSLEKHDKDNYIEPSYVVLDSDERQETLDDVRHYNGARESDNRLEESIHFMKAIVTKSLKIEVARKLSSSDFKQMESHLGGDIEQVANALSFAIGQGKDALFLQRKGHDVRSISRKLRTLHGDHVVRAVGYSVQETRYLRKVLPVGVVIGTSLAALRKHFNVATDQKIGLSPAHEAEYLGDNNQENFDINEIGLDSSRKNDQTDSSKDITRRNEKDADLGVGTTNDVMFGAVTAALGASALLMAHQNGGQETVEKSLESQEGRGDYQKAADKVVETTCDKDQNNIVTIFAERALLVAAPVVPTKDDGEVDQDRLVSMLGDLVQRGGALRLVGKMALLWGGIRGAMSLTDRLISFLRIAERPLYLRILGFVGMVLVLWSPFVIPFVPVLVQSWTAQTPRGFSELVCITGLYSSILTLLIIWGRRICGYEDPLKQYGLELEKLPKGLFKGFAGGVMLVLSIQAVNALFGWSSFSWPSSLPPSSVGLVTWLRAHGKLMMLVGRGIITATGVVLVEELLFRSWLPEEIAVDLGYHRGIIISGLVFSLIQRSLWAVPGLWLFSLALAGFRQRSQGSLAIPIGLRAGIMVSSFVLQTGGFLAYKSSLPVWATGTHPLQPFSGVVGLSYSLVLAILVYRKPLLKEGNDQTYRQQFCDSSVLKRGPLVPSNVEH